MFHASNTCSFLSIDLSIDTFIRCPTININVDRRRQERKRTYNYLSAMFDLFNWNDRIKLRKVHHLLTVDDECSDLSCKFSDRLTKTNVLSSDVVPFLSLSLSGYCISISRSVSFFSFICGQIEAELLSFPL